MQYGQQGRQGRGWRRNGPVVVGGVAGTLLLLVLISLVLPEAKSPTAAASSPGTAGVTQVGVPSAPAATGRPAPTATTRPSAAAPAPPTGKRDYRQMQRDVQSLDQVMFPLGTLTTVADRVCVLLGGDTSYDDTARQVQPSLGAKGATFQVAQDVVEAAWTDVCT